MYKRIQILLVIALMLGSLLGLRAQEPTVAPDDLGILIVGDTTNAQMKALEDTTIEELRRMIRAWPADKRPSIFSYHFDRKKERAYCEQKLNILTEDLLFVGIVRLDKKVPRKVVYRIDRLVNPTRSADEVIDRAKEMLGVFIVNPASPSPSPTPSQSASPDLSPDSGSFRIQLGVFSQRRNAEDLVTKLRESGHVASITSAEENGTQAFKVQIGPFSSKQEALTAIDSLKAQGFSQAFLVEDE